MENALEYNGEGPRDFGRVLDSWLAEVKLRVKRSSLSTYSGIIERYIRPALGGFGQNEITPERLSEFFVGIGQHAPSTVRGVCYVLRSSLGHARELCFEAAEPRGLYMPRSDRTEARTLSKEDQRRLERELYMEMDEPRLGILLSLYTGIRLGELCALKWGDIDGELSSICIRRTVQRLRLPQSVDGRRSTIVFDSPKSRASNRRIPIPHLLSPLLAEYRANDECYLLTGDPVRFIEPGLMQKRFKTVLRRAGIEDINFHALRHTFATNCVALGCDPATLSRMLGHSSVAITLNIYVHPSFDAMRCVMDRLGV